MKRLLITFVAALLVLAAEIQAAPRSDIPDDDTAAVRYFGQWWATVSGSEPLQLRRGYADDLFEAGNYGLAKQRYRKLARYGDKFAQFRLGIIAMKSEYRGTDLPSAFAWFTLAEEGGLHSQFEGYADRLWARMTAAQRQQASLRLKSLSEDYSDLALARLMKHVYRQTLRSSTGSRAGFTALPLSFEGGPAGVTPDQFYQQVKQGLEVNQTFIENYGEVELGDFEVIEPDQERQ